MLSEVSREWWQLIASGTEPPASVDAGLAKHLDEFKMRAQAASLFVLGIGEFELESNTAYMDLGREALDLALRLWPSPASRSRKQKRSEHRAPETILKSYCHEVRTKYKIVGDILFNPFAASADGKSIEFVRAVDARACLRAGLAEAERWPRHKQRGISRRFASFWAQMYARVISIDPDVLRMPSNEVDRDVVVICSGVSKAKALRVALCGGIGTSLVVDRDLAHAVLYQSS
jgi:hypothetical protein